MARRRNSRFGEVDAGNLPIPSFAVKANTVWHRQSDDPLGKVVKVGWCVEIDFAAWERHFDNRICRIGQDSARSLIAFEEKESREQRSREHRRNAASLRIDGGRNR